MGILDFLRQLFGPKETILDGLVQPLDEEIKWHKSKGSGRRVRIYSGKKHHTTVGRQY